MEFRLSRTIEYLIILGILAGYLALAVSLARVRPPHDDEGNFGNAAVTFIERHELAMPMSNKVWLPGLDKHMYVTMPLYFVGLAAWFKVFGVGLITMRYYSIMWGVLLLVSWYIIVRVLSGEATTALLSMLLIGCNYDYANLTSGRYDVMSAALSAAGIAAYLAVRERSVGLALLVSNILVAAACMSHPYGLFGFVGLAILVLGFDRRSIKPIYMLVSALPYVVALGAWGLYVLQDPVIARVQFHGNAQNRLLYLFHPLAGWVAEVKERYLVIAGGLRPGVPNYMKLKLVVLAAIAASIAACIALPEIRRHKGYRLLLAVTAVWFVMLVTLDSTKTYIYLVHIWPAYFALMAICLATVMKMGKLARCAAVAAVVGLVLFSFISVGYRVRLNSYDRVFVPAERYLEQRMKDNVLVIAPAEFGFALGFEKHVLNDRNLGYKMGVKPEYIVIDREWEQQIVQVKKMDPARRAYMDNLLSTQYQLEFTSKSGFDFYRIYSLKSAVAGDPTYHRENAL